MTEVGAKLGKIYHDIVRSITLAHVHSHDPLTLNKSDFGLETITFVCL